MIARLAGLSSSLETAAREDAPAREQASIELARYDTLVAERREAERALAEARQVRTTAELLSNQAFPEKARAQAAQHTAVARVAELACAELLAERFDERLRRHAAIDFVAMLSLPLRLFRRKRARPACAAGRLSRHRGGRRPGISIPLRWHWYRCSPPASATCFGAGDPAQTLFVWLGADGRFLRELPRFIRTHRRCT